MLKAFRDPTYQHFSSFVLGLACVIVGYLGLALGVILGYPVSNWLWFSGIPVVLIGFLIDAASRRLLWIRVYQTTLFLLCTLSILRFLLISLLKDSEINMFWVGIVVSIVICSVIGAAFWQTMSSPLRASMPHGALGRLDNFTGFVYPKQSPPKIKEEWEKTKTGLVLVFRLTPIIAGLAMFMVQIMSASSMMPFVNFLFSLGILFFAYGIGSYAAYAVCINQWEALNHRRMYVKFTD